VSAAYCTRGDLTTLGIRSDALRSILVGDQDAAIASASDEMDGYLGSRYKLPLTAWGSDVRIMCARLAIYSLISARGFNPNSSGDSQLVEMRDIAERWLVRISNGSLALTVTDSSNVEAGHVSGGVQLVSNRSRGYQNDGSRCGGAFTGGNRR
jgi:phage gp36-like protein